MDDEKLVFTVEEARQQLRLSRSSIYQAINSGQLQAIRLGRRILIPRSVLERLLELAPKQRND